MASNPPLDHPCSSRPVDPDPDSHAFLVLLPDRSARLYPCSQITAGHVLEDFPDHWLSLLPSRAMPLLPDFALLPSSTYYLHPAPSGATPSVLPAAVPTPCRPLHQRRHGLSCQFPASATFLDGPPLQPLRQKRSTFPGPQPAQSQPAHALLLAELGPNSTASPGLPSALPLGPKSKSRAGSAHASLGSVLDAAQLWPGPPIPRAPRHVSEVFSTRPRPLLADASSMSADDQIVGHLLAQRRGSPSAAASQEARLPGGPRPQRDQVLQELHQFLDAGRRCRRGGAPTTGLPKAAGGLAPGAPAAAAAARLARHNSILAELEQLEALDLDALTTPVQTSRGGPTASAADMEEGHRHPSSSAVACALGPGSGKAQAVQEAQPEGEGGRAESRGRSVLALLSRCRGVGPGRKARSSSHDMTPNSRGHPDRSSMWTRSSSAGSQLSAEEPSRTYKGEPPVGHANASANASAEAGTGQGHEEWNSSFTYHSFAGVSYHEPGLMMA